MFSVAHNTRLHQQENIYHVFISFKFQNTEQERERIALCYRFSLTSRSLSMAVLSTTHGGKKKNPHNDKTNSNALLNANPGLKEVQRVPSLSDYQGLPLLCLSYVFTGAYDE